MKSSRFSSMFRRAVASVGIALVALAACAQPASDPPTAQAPHFWADPALRTIVVAAPADRPEKRGEILLTNLVGGVMPAGARRATVLTDSNCAPDADGVSHCLNELQIGDARVMVQHHHDMSAVPCLTPGETVNVLDAQAFKQL
jgi:hypothetical protein